jgi:hypothetical protein
VADRRAGGGRDVEIPDEGVFLVGQRRLRQQQKTESEYVKPRNHGALTVDSRRRHKM